MSWFFKGDSTWVPYSSDDSTAIEAAYQSQQRRGVYKLNSTYNIDFKQNRQFRADDNNRWRAVKREGPGGEKKGGKAAGSKRTRRATRKHEDEEEEEADTEPEEDEEEEEDDVGEDEDYEEDGEEEEPGSAKKNKTKTTTPAPKKGSATNKKKATTAVKPITSPTPSSSTSDADSAATRRVVELEEKNQQIINDYEKEIEGMHNEMTEKSAEYEAKIKGLEEQVREVEGLKRQVRVKDEELMKVKEELEELHRDHDVLVQTLSTALPIIGKRGKGGGEAAGAKTDGGVKRPREQVEEEKKQPNPPNKRAHADDDATQLVSQTLALDDVDMTSLFSVYSPSTLLSSASRSPSLHGLLDRHLINPDTLNHSHRPLCCAPLSRNDLLIGFSGGRLEWWDVNRYQQKVVVKGDKDGVNKSERVEMDETARGESNNIHCITSFTARGGERMVAMGKGKRLVLYTVEDEELTERQVVSHARGCFVSSLCVMREGWLCVGLTGTGYGVKVYDIDQLMSGGQSKPLHSLVGLTVEVRKIVQLNDGRLAVAGCSALQQHSDTIEKGAIELWTLSTDRSTRSIIVNGPTVSPDVGLRCNSLCLLNPTEGGGVSRLVATYEYCTTGDRMMQLHTLKAGEDRSGKDDVVEAQHRPAIEENTYTSITAYGGDSVIVLTYGGVVSEWKKEKSGEWKKVKTIKAEEELDGLEDSSVVALEDGRIVTCGGSGSVKLYR